MLVTTFAKSGTNWMMQIAQQIAHRGDASFDHIHDVVAWPDSPAAGPVALDAPGPLASSPTGLRVVKTHLEPEFVPYDRRAVYLTVLRDPKEVVVSSYYFLGGLFGVLSHVTIGDWLELFLRPPSVGSWWAVHTAGYWAWRDRPNVLVLGYGEMHRDPRAAIERVAGVMGVRLTADELESVARRSSFEYMRAHEWQFAPPRPPLASEADHPRMVRSGKVGGSGELLSPTQQAAVDRFCRDELRRLGSDVPYDDFFGGAGA